MPVVSETILGVSTTTCLSPNPGQIRERMLIKFAIPAPGAVRRSGPGIDPSADTGEGAPCTLSGYVADPGQRVRPAGFRPEIIYVRTRMAPVPSARPARAGRYLKNGLFYLSARPRRNAPAPTGSIHQTWERMNEAYSQALYSAAPSVEESTPPGPQAGRACGSAVVTLTRGLIPPFAANQTPTHDGGSPLPTMMRRNPSA